MAFEKCSVFFSLCSIYAFVLQCQPLMNQSHTGIGNNMYFPHVNKI